MSRCISCCTFSTGGLDWLGEGSTSLYNDPRLILHVALAQIITHGDQN